LRRKPRGKFEIIRDILDYVDRDEHPSVGVAMYATGISYRTFKKYLRMLVERGFLEVYEGRICVWGKPRTKLLRLTSKGRRLLRMLREERLEVEF